MSAPKLTFDQGKSELEFRLTDSDIEVEDSDSGSTNSLSFQEAEHLHAWLEIVLSNRLEANCG